MGKYISGFAEENNLAKWADYAKKNSYGDNKRQCRDQLAPVGRGGRENDWSDDWKQPQKDKEGRGWSGHQGDHRRQHLHRQERV